MEQSITISNINKKYGNKEILNDISFEAQRGRITAFLGPNGAGKSTTLRILLGLDSADSGKALIGGKKYSKWHEPLKKIGASFDGVGSPNDRTVYQHLRIISVSNGIPKERISEVMDITGIAHKASSQIGSLSLGEGQRLGIAAALIGDPQFLVFDEPTSGLDFRSMECTAELLRSLDEDITVLIVTHDMELIDRCCTHILHIENGGIESGCKREGAI
jgi:ABC-2 type transport system ATP-binding protein